MVKNSTLWVFFQEGLMMVDAPSANLAFYPTLKLGRFGLGPILHPQSKMHARDQVERQKFAEGVQKKQIILVHHRSQ